MCRLQHGRCGRSITYKVEIIGIMINKLKDSKHAGTFTLSSDRDIYGELTLAGPNTSLYIQDKEDFDANSILDQCVKGVLHDLTKVTLIQCITTSGTGVISRKNERNYNANIFPHFVVYGNNHIIPTEKNITEVHFVVDDANILFYDFDAFGSLINARPFIEEIAHANRLKRTIITGENPEIVYFTGKNEIFTANTILGEVSASHNPRCNMDSPNGVFIENTISVAITFKETVNFYNVISDISTLLAYLEILVGRPQNLLSMDLLIEHGEEPPISFQVYWSMAPKRNPSHESQRPHPSDILLNAVQQPDTFSLVLTNWLDRHQTWRDARLRFSNSFANQQYYTVDRLIGSANMFDILPSSSAPPTVQLSEELEHATKKCREIFKNLPQTPERNSILNALGRIGKSTLKNKIRYRSQFILNHLGDQFPELFKVIDAAVDCRNHYVHGSNLNIDYNRNDMIPFLTETLEFIFAASDLIEAGWDIKEWNITKKAMSHPFSQYCVDYAENLRQLKNCHA